MVPQCMPLAHIPPLVHLQVERVVEVDMEEEVILTGPKPGGSKPVIERPDRGVTGGSLTDPIENPGEYKPSENSSSNNTQLIERGNLVIGVIQLLGQQYRLLH